MAGRKTKYTPDTVQRITEAIRLGATYELACGYAGIGVTTFHDWLNAKPEFSQAIKEAEGKGAIGWLAKIEKAASEGTWQAAAWKLERRYPQQYGRQIQEHQGTMSIDYAGLSITELDRELLALLARGPKVKTIGPPTRAQLPVGNEGED